MATVSELTQARELFRNLTLRELRGKYKRSALGWAWSMINPLATMGIFTVVFHFLINVEPDRGHPSGLKSFPFFLLCGLLPWNFLLNGLMNGMGAPLANGGLIKKVYFPREVLTASVVAAWAVQFLIELAVLMIALLFVGNVAFAFIPGVLLVLVIQMFFTYGIALALGALNVYFRDVQHFMGLFTQLWFYATPVVYPLSLVEGHRSIYNVYKLNPMVRFVSMYRDLMYDLRWPPMYDIAYVLGCAILSVLVGRWIFLKLEPRFAEEL
ncbi:MAG: lipopolysaccharide transport system permease protein [Actinomycetota bacterium]|jgi:ABC-2 type transport system permease protein